MLRTWRTPTAVVAALAATATGALVVACGHQETGSASHPSRPNLAAPPADLRWQDYQGVAVPTGADGPHGHNDAVATGFSRTPQGAALAAITHDTHMSLVEDTEWAAVAAAELAPGPGTDAWKTTRVLWSFQGPAKPGLAPKVLGYRISSYNPARTAVTVYCEYPDHSVTADDLVVVWLGGDWLLQLPDPSSATRTVFSVSGPPRDAVRLAAA